MYYLEANNIVKQYASHRALDDVTVHVPENCIYGLLGPNGAGKTTLIRIINHITGPDSGEIILNGRPSVPSDVENIGYLPEERGLYKKMKVGEQLMYLARLKGLSRTDAQTRIRTWLKKFEITDWEKKKVEELSKGMQQKIQFIATVIHRPRLLIFDEPFSGFDPVNANLLKNEILELRKEGATIIFSTHNMSSVEEICDEITLINRSHAVLQGKIGEIRESHKKHLFKVSYTQGAPLADTPLYDIVEITGETTAVVRKRDKATTNNELIHALMQHCELTMFEEILPTMNEIFIETVGETNHTDLLS
ncbi:MAG TPA: ATP-binding cassette domain-containing protein [Candidatus Barnesiella excrementipullorum]|uniref:ATP-binding cassette domain-containing protein n=1 Tax=Candidatus Barnesiella excrementipullorum TaxID=2838479 RepID=A0A9D2AQ17_9BACT|nr:ATP-binding cassette domain-containing protein [Candidatus Barnesiella excrementipullorum]